MQSPADAGSELTWGHSDDRFLPLLRCPFYNSVSPSEKVPAMFGEDLPTLHRLVSDLVEGTWGAWLIPVLVGSSTCSPGVSQTARWSAGLWVGHCRTRLQHSEPVLSAMVLSRWPFPAQPPQRLSYTVIPCTFPDDLGPLSWSPLR